MKYFLHFLLLFSGCASQSQGQEDHTISGVVIDAEFKTPLDGITVIVSIFEQGRIFAGMGRYRLYNQVTTDKSGHFEFTVDEGAKIIIGSSSGSTKYGGRTVKLEVTSDQKDIVIEHSR